MRWVLELRRRRVFRAAGLYAVVAWVTTEVSATVLPLLLVPEKYVTIIVLALIAFFPVAMVLAWFYDIRSGGLEKTPEPSEVTVTAERPGVLFPLLLLFVVMIFGGYGLYRFGEARAFQAIPRSSIAVLPFENLSNDAKKDYFCDGMSEEILNALTHVEGLSIPARTSSFAYRGGGQDVRKIGRELGVETILEGSVRWNDEDDRVRITAQLVDASTGYHLWSENFDRKVADVISVQSEIAKAIVDVLRIKLGVDQAGMAAPTSDAQAYDLYLRGRQLLNKRKVGAIRESIDYFNQAIARDPEFVSALAATAVAFVSLPILTGEPVDQPHAKAEQLVTRVLVLAPEFAEAHAVRAWLAQYNGDWSRADFGYFAATSMDPHDVTTRVWYSEFLLAAGLLAQAQTQVERALGLESDNPLTQAATAMSAMIRNDNESCVASAGQARDLGFSRLANEIEGICLARSGDLEAASEALAAGAGPALGDSALASLAAALPRSDSLLAAAALASKEEGAWRNEPWAVWVLAAAGETERAFARLADGFDGGGFLHLQLLWMPEAAGLRSDARFLDLMQYSGVARIWRNDPPDLCSKEDGEFRCR